MTTKPRELLWTPYRRRTVVPPVDAVDLETSDSSTSPTLSRSHFLLWLRFFSILGMILWLLLGWAYLSHADDRVNPIEDSVESGTNALLSNETPGMVIVLTYQQIRARGYRSVYEILRDLPGVYTRGGYGEGFVNLTFDGDLSQNNQNFLLFVDGVRQQDLWRRSNWLSFQYSTYFIKNITVFYGPAATRFGANAASAVIYIDTFKPEDLQEGYGDVSLSKDIRNNAWSLDVMLGHSYTKRSNPKLALSLFSWYMRGRLYYSEDRNPEVNELSKPTNWSNPNDPRFERYAPLLRESKSFLDNALSRYRSDIFNSYPGAFSSVEDPNLDRFVSQYRQSLLNAYLRDPANSGLFANPTYNNQNLSFSGEAGFRFDNWFLQLKVWSTGAGSGLQYLPHYVQSSQWWVRQFSLSLNHLKSEIWSSGVGEKAQVIYFNLSIVFQRHEVPGHSLTLNFAPRPRQLTDPVVIRGVAYQPRCTDIPGGSNQIPCVYQDYSWRPTYTYVVSNSFRAQPKLDFRLLNGHLMLSAGVNAGVGFIQGPAVTANRPNPEDIADPNTERGAGNQYEHIYLTGFVQSEMKFTSFLYANLGIRSDWELVRGKLEEVQNCERSLIPCYRFSAPLLGRASILTKFWEGKLQTRLSYNYAFITPSNWELFGGAAGDSLFESSRGALNRALDARTLLPQDKHSVEFNIYANVASRFYFTLSVFHHWLNNVPGVVNLTFRQNQTRYLSLGNQTTWGGRFHAIVKLFSWMSVTANVSLVYPRLWANNLFVPAQNPIQLREFPLFQGNLIVDFRSHPYDLSHFFGSIRANFISGRRTTTFEQLQNGTLQLAAKQAETGFAAVLHLSAGYLWRPPDTWKFPRFISASATVENLINTPYNDLGILTALGPVYSPIVPQSGINAFFRLSMGF